MQRRLISLTRDARLPLVLTILSGLLTGLLTIWQAWLLSTIISAVFLEGLLREQVIPLLLLMLVPITGRALLTWLNEVSASAIAVRIKSDLRETLFIQLTRLGPAYTRGGSAGELVTSIFEGIEELDTFFSRYLPQLAITGLVPISILAFVFPIDLLTGFVLMITAPLIPLFMVLIGKGAEIVTQRQYDTLRILSANFLDSLQGLTTLKIFGQSRVQSKNIAHASDSYRETTLRVLRIAFLSAFALELLATLSTAIIAVEIGFRLLYGQMDFQPALFLLLLAPEFYMPLRALGARFHAGKAGTTAAVRIFEILDMPLPRNPQPEPGLPSTGEFSKVIFDGVNFSYPGKSIATLQDISLTVRKGEHIALVGKTGAGKTTFVNLLLGFLQPTSGQILTQFISSSSGHSFVTTQGPPALLGVAWVSQQPYLFHDTIAANILLGKPDATHEQVVKAAQAAHLNRFIDSLPQKYKTIIGENGARLSSGQAQRLALARAFLKGADLLVLDEPSSNLDPNTETLLDASIQRLMKGKTVITVAHRLNTVFQADRIVVFDHGRIVEQGKHTKLISKNGQYAGMVKALKVDTGKLKKTGTGTSYFNREASPFNPQLAMEYSPAHGSSKNINILKRLLGFLNGSWDRVALSVTLGALTIGANISLMGTSAWLISTAALQPSVAELGVAVVGVRFFGLCRAVFRYFERLVSHDITFRLLTRLRVWFYEKLEPLAPARLGDYRAGDLLARIISDVTTLENFYVRVVSPALVALIIGGSTAAFLAIYHPALAAVLVGFFLILGILIPLSAWWLGRKPGTALISKRADLQIQLVDGIQGLADLLAYGRASDQGRLIAQTEREYGQAQMRMAVLSGWHNGLGTLLPHLGVWLVVYLTLPLVTGHQINGAMLAALALLTLASFEAVTPLPQAAQLWESVRSSAGRVFEIVDAEPLVAKEVSKAKGSTAGVAGPDRHPSIEFSKLTFHYPNQTLPSLDQISFKVEPGQSLAVVGASGAGKSTLVNLLLRFWEYEQGEILLDGRSLHELQPEQTRAQLAVVSQRSYFFNTSVRSNLRLARPDATQAEIEAAARRVNLHDFILSLPEGYDTRIGEWGSRLSGGERQRLAIARALLKDTPILILDEPTANLDTITEQQVMKSLVQSMAGRTCLLITHRLVGLDTMDEILVMSGGRIVERGRLVDLLAREGGFHHLWDLQNRILDLGALPIPQA